ncbi:TonB-dependent receptor domain-containing protein [Caulobacter sp.]|uniref:TonB-dependent receptor domain-containing protein n=1 Tax=Caulobacter sp. TaxID=78 RepID=UPI002B4A0269|nr:TonB-dependent receptor [Caulobacter sp.]
MSAALLPFLMVMPAHAETIRHEAADAPVKTAGATAHREKVFSTGVAKGRDLLDSAISASSLGGDVVPKLSARSLADVLRNVPGIRTEGSFGDGNSNYTIRGLPLTSGGSKFMQIQEDGLPVLEFGDLFNASSDTFIRYDQNIGSIEAVRGGSASTFASNSPGGVINLISKTGEEEGGAIEVSTGVDYGEKRLDFEYGGKMTDTLRYHFGGFYRSGEGVRNIGFNGVKGGQLKFNVTKTLPNGYIRLSGKYLDDRSPWYFTVPVKISGTPDKPTFENFNNFDVRQDTLLSRNIPTFTSLDRNNLPSVVSTSNGMHAKVKSIGLEAQFDIAGWTITERGRISGIGGSIGRAQISNVFAGNALPATLGAGAGTLTYASGPLRGQTITNPASLNGNGLIVQTLANRLDIKSLNYFANDLRATRSWNVGEGSLTLTGGVYHSSQDVDTDWYYETYNQDLLGDGRSSLIDFTNAAGVAQTQDGVTGYSLNGASGLYRRAYDVNYDITAPFASANYKIGKLAIGGSLRYDLGQVRGQLYGSDLGGGRVGLGSYDFNSDGKISVAEAKTAFLPTGSPAPVHYDYKYVSYSAGANYRVAEPLSVFARYSRGARAGADKILFSSTTGVSSVTGDLLSKGTGYDLVKQLEGGFKFRKADMTLNATAFLANTEDTNIQSGGGAQPERKYRSYGAEIEASVRKGPFSVFGSMTYTHAEILSDTANPVLAGMTPRRQPKFIFSATPQFETKYATVGANIIANTWSYSHDNNQTALHQPGYVIVGAFAQVPVTENLQVMVNVNNLFNKMAFYELNQTAIPANGIGWGRAFNGRTISASARLSF